MNGVKHKKFIGCFLAFLIIATVGAVFATAQTDESNGSDIQEKPFWGRGKMPLCSEHLFYELTDEQEEEIMQMRETMREEGASFDEIQDAVMEKLDEYGILDQRLDSAIEQTEQRLDMLNRKKELREQGYSWEEINDMMQEEFDIEIPDINTQGQTFHHGFHQGSTRGKRNFIEDEDLDTESDL